MTIVAVALTITTYHHHHHHHHQQHQHHRELRSTAVIAVTISRSRTIVMTTTTSTTFGILQHNTIWQHHESLSSSAALMNISVSVSLIEVTVTPGSSLPAVKTCAEGFDDSSPSPHRCVSASNDPHRGLTPSVMRESSAKPLRHRPRREVELQFPY